MNQTLHLKTLEEAKNFILSHSPALFIGSATSTVIPFESLVHLKELDAKTSLVYTGQLPKSMELVQLSDTRAFLRVTGAISWLEAKEFLSQTAFELMTTPTEELASILSGVATSATGERSFGFGNLRSQILSVDMIMGDGQIRKLNSERSLDDIFCEFHFSENDLADIRNYQNEFKQYETFKNAPFPRLMCETDLATGFEGQLGLIIGAEIKLKKRTNSTYLFIELDHWAFDFSEHVKLHFILSDLREKVFAAELLDAHSLKYLPTELKLKDEKDYVFLELAQEAFDEVIEILIQKLESVSSKLTMEQMFQMEASKCRALRMAVPRTVFEENSRKGVTKKGTDIQVAPADFSKLLSLYQELAKKGLEYNMFGHFGDAHLHFNFMPKPEQDAKCQELFHQLYRDIQLLKASPFAEHGIGLLKRKFIASFYSEHQAQVFKILKSKFDPHRQFFPEGFMQC